MGGLYKKLILEYFGLISLKDLIVEGFLSLQWARAGNCREMKCSGCQIYTVTTCRLPLVVISERAHGLLEMGSKLGRDMRLWYLAIYGITDVWNNLAKASEGSAVAPQAVEEKLEGTCTPTVCKNMWEGYKEPSPAMSQGEQVPEATPGWGLKMYQKWVRGKTNAGCTATLFFRQVLLAISC